MGLNNHLQPRCVNDDWIYVCQISGQNVLNASVQWPFSDILLKCNVLIHIMVNLTYHYIVVNVNLQMDPITTVKHEQTSPQCIYTKNTTNKIHLKFRHCNNGCNQWRQHINNIRQTFGVNFPRRTGEHGCQTFFAALSSLKTHSCAPWPYPETQVDTVMVASRHIAP